MSNFTLATAVGFLLALLLSDISRSQQGRTFGRDGLPHVMLGLSRRGRSGRRGKGFWAECGATRPDDPETTQWRRISTRKIAPHHRWPRRDQDSWRPRDAGMGAIVQARCRTRLGWSRRGRAHCRAAHRRPDRFHRVTAKLNSRDVCPVHDTAAGASRRFVRSARLNGMAPPVLKLRPDRLSTSQ